MKNGKQMFAFSEKMCYNSDVKKNTLKLNLVINFIGGVILCRI